MRLKDSKQKTLELAMVAAPGLQAADSTSTNSPSVPSIPSAPPKSKAIPFHGKLASVDKVAKTITLEGATKRTIEITSQTKIMRNGKPATLENAMVGDSVGGSYIKNAEGKLSAKTVRFGPKVEPTAKPAQANPEASK